jgi:hypothetical protein
MELTQSKFPLYMSYENAFMHLRSCKTAHDFTEKLLQTLVQDTPWSYSNIREICDELGADFHIPYTWNTIRRRLYEFRRLGEVKVFDDNFSNSSQYLYQWAGSQPFLKPKSYTPKVGRVTLPQRELSKTDPIVRFLEKVIQNIFK